METGIASARLDPDQGIALYRRVLEREIRNVEAGRDPMATIRDPAKNRRIDLPNERKKHHNSDGLRSWMMRTHAAYSPILDDLIELFEPQKRFQRVALMEGALRP